MEYLIFTLLLELTKVIVDRGQSDPVYGFGGLDGYGYGANYENSVFMIHRYCWCDEETCSWCGEAHAPNFFHSASGLTVNWYKYIGRGMVLENVPSKEEVIRIFQECINSVKGESNA